jgi:hypothetical protein
VNPECPWGSGVYREPGLDRPLAVAKWSDVCPLDSVQNEVSPKPLLHGERWTCGKRASSSESATRSMLYRGL